MHATGPLKTATEILDPPVLAIDFQITQEHTITFAVRAGGEGMA